MASPKASKQVRSGGAAKPPNAGKGRKKGVPNRSTREVREVVAEFAKAYAPEFEGWIDRVAKTDPARAAELYLRALEYHIPKLTRTHVTASRSTLEELVAGAGLGPTPSSDLRPAIQAEPVPATSYQVIEPVRPAEPALPAPAQAPAAAPSATPPSTPPRDPLTVQYRNHRPLLEAGETALVDHDPFRNY